MRLGFALPLLGVVCLGGCAQVDSTTRVERGPLLRTFHRPQVLDGPVHGTAQVQWPVLRLELTATDVCRDLTVEEYAEENITERSAPAAGPAFSTGIANLLASGILFGVSFAVSNRPDTTSIDAAGHYGPPERDLLRGWSVATLAIGVPALAVAIISSLRTGETVDTQRAEQVTSQKDSGCHPRPMTGPVALRGTRGPLVEKTASDGVVAIEASEVHGAVEEVLASGRVVELDEASMRALDAFVACALLETDGAPAPESLGEGALLGRAERLRSCRDVRQETIAPQLAAVERELSRRRESGTPGAFPAGAKVRSFEDAVSAYAPRLHLAAGSGDLARLDAPEALSGQAVFIDGLVSEGLASNIGVLQVGERQVFMFIPPEHAWSGDFGNGARVEAVAVVVGWQTVGEKTLPLVRAVWMRPKF